MSTERDLFLLVAVRAESPIPRRSAVEGSGIGDSETYPVIDQWETEVALFHAHPVDGARGPATLKSIST